MLARLRRWLALLNPWANERLDTEEDLADRERMLDDIEQAHYDRMRAKLFGRQDLRDEGDLL